MSISSEGRRRPRRFIGADGRAIDMRAFTRNTLVMFGLVPLGLGSACFTLASHEWSRGLLLGVIIAASAITLGCLINIRFEGRNLGQTADFWLRHEGIVAPRVLAGTVVVALTALVFLVGGVVARDPFLADVAIAPGFVAASLLLLESDKRRSLRLARAVE